MKSKTLKVKNYYAKREIYRVMSWGNNDGITDEDFKFERLRHYFELYFGLRRPDNND